MRVGVFEDSAIERWYVLWRADNVTSFYKGTVWLNLGICVLHCLYGICKAFALEYFALVVGEFKFWELRALLTCLIANFS